MTIGGEGASAAPDNLPDTPAPITGKGHDSDRLRRALAERRIKACIPGRANRDTPVAFDTDRPVSLMRPSRKIIASNARDKMKGDFASGPDQGLGIPPSRAGSPAPSAGDDESRGGGGSSGGSPPSPRS